MSSECVLALDIGGTKLAAGVVDEDGCVRCKRVTATRASEGAEQALERALDLAGAALLEAQSEERHPTALGVSTNGLTREDGVDLAPSVPGWSNLHIPARLRERFAGLPMAIVNDVKAATVAEMEWGALRGITNGVYVNLGTGVAAGIVIEGKLVQGEHGAAGEIGYMVPSTEALAGLRPDEAPLEELIGGRGIASRAEREFGETVTAAGLLATVRPDVKADALRAQLLDEIALWIANISIVLDPGRVVLGGGLMSSGGGLSSRVRDALERSVPFPPEVVPAFFGAGSALVGAGAVALGLARGVAPERASASKGVWVNKLAPGEVTATNEGR
jgi:glucokinase